MKSQFVQVVQGKPYGVPPSRKLGEGLCTYSRIEIRLRVCDRLAQQVHVLMRALDAFKQISVALIQRAHIQVVKRSVQETIFFGQFAHFAESDLLIATDARFSATEGPQLRLQNDHGIADPQAASLHFAKFLNLMCKAGC